MSFLKVWGCDAYVKKLHPEKLEHNAEKCVFIGYAKEKVGYTFYLRSEGKVFVAKNGIFLEKGFLSKKMSESKIELDEVVEPLLQPECRGAQKYVSMGPISIEEEGNDDDHGDLDQVAIEPRRSTRARTAPHLYGKTVLTVMLLDKLWRSDGEPEYQKMFRGHEI